jgi:hypothetical protein
MHGYDSVVGPVKGVTVANKDDKRLGHKARSNVVLVEDRPWYVTQMSVVRDAAARLPNGRGTRAEVVELLKDSQYLRADVGHDQLMAMVSGSLDRLQAETDPCVKHDRGLWVYQHHARTPETLGMHGRKLGWDDACAVCKHWLCGHDGHGAIIHVLVQRRCTSQRLGAGAPSGRRHGPNPMRPP